MDHTMSDIQAVLFDRKSWTTRDALKWLRNHDFKPIKRVHTTAEFYRYRLIEPSEFKTFRTDKQDGGIEFIFGFY